MLFVGRFLHSSPIIYSEQLLFLGDISVFTVILSTYIVEINSKLKAANVLYPWILSSQWLRLTQVLVTTGGYTPSILLHLYIFYCRGYASQRHKMLRALNNVSDNRLRVSIYFTQYDISKQVTKRNTIYRPLKKRKWASPLPIFLRSNGS